MRTPGGLHVRYHRLAWTIVIVRSYNSRYMSRLDLRDQHSLVRGHLRPLLYCCAHLDIESKVPKPQCCK